MPTAPPATRPGPGPWPAAWTSSRPASTDLRAQEELAAIRPDLDGNQVMARLGLKPGPAVGEALAWLLELRLEEGPLGAEEAGRRLDAWWAGRQGSTPGGTGRERRTRLRRRARRPPDVTPPANGPGLRSTHRAPPARPSASPTGEPTAQAPNAVSPGRTTDRWRRRRWRSHTSNVDAVMGRAR